MNDQTSIAQAYVDAWNERDAQRRMAAVSRLWTAEASYVDPLMQGSGHTEIAGLIAAVQARFPDFRFSLAGTADAYADKLRFSWNLGPESGPAVIRGTDFAELEDGRLNRVVGFLDQVPAA